jgi:hypothetical protein
MEMLAIDQIILLCLIFLLLVALAWQLNRNTNEHFVSTDPKLASLMNYYITSLKEAQELLNGTWNENLTSMPKHQTCILYYSVFSADSRGSLVTSPYTWQNISPLFAFKLPDNCKVNDSKIVFMSKPFTDPLVLGMCSNGITLNNKGNGPPAMHMGLNVYSTDPQAFSLSFLVKFNSLLNFAGQTIQQRQDLIAMKANTSNNNGLKISYDITNTQIADHYSIEVRVALGTNTDAVIGPFDIYTQSNYSYVVSVVRNGDTTIVSFIKIDTLETATPVILGSTSFQYTDIIDFSNTPMQISGGLNVSQLLAFQICQEALSSGDLVDVAVYWKQCIIKTGAVASAMSQQVLIVNTCPFSDQVCQECPDIKDWSNTSHLIMADSNCRQAYHLSCAASNTQLGCECYAPTNTSQQCQQWKSLIQGTSSCSQSELNNYLSSNVPVAIVNNNGPTLSNEKIIDYYTTQEYEFDATLETHSTVSFWAWLMGKR